MAVKAPQGKDRKVVYRVPAGRFGVNVAVMTEARFGHPPLAMVEIVDRRTDEVVFRPIAYPEGGDGMALAQGAARLIGKSVRAVAAHLDPEGA